MRTLVVAIMLVGFVSASGLQAQEHPEHPEHPEKKPAATEMTIDELADAITNYIEQDTELKGGAFLVLDAQQDKVLQLQLSKVHKERLSSLGHGVYFACTDMKATDGTIYDLDFFMKQAENGIETTEVAIHKKAGKARYGWREDNGIWKKTKN